jgi:membrane protease subunit HflK
MTDVRRGKNTALVATAFHAAFTVVMLIVWLWSDSAAARAATVFLAAGILPWLMTVVLFYCRQLAQQEAAELDKLADQSSATIFQGEAYAAQRLAGRRLERLERWGVPIFTLLWAAVSGLAGWWMLAAARTPASINIAAAAPTSMVVIVVGFLAFLLSFYILGMARQASWRPLRAPGSYLLVSVLMLAGVIGSLVAAWQEVPVVDRIVAYVAPALQLLLAIELVANFVFDIYRPRVGASESRLCYDSRMLHLIAEPQQLGRSIAETLNYQFGFEVSQTWFYQLLQKTFVPLIVFAAVAMVAISSVVIVEQGQQATVTMFGKLQPEVLGPGLHLKAPWPIGRVTYYPEQVRSLQLGAGHAMGEHNVIHEGPFRGREVAQWAVEHGHGGHTERNFLVAVHRSANGTGDETIPAVNIIKLTAVLQYRIVDPIAYEYTFVDPDTMLDCIAHREMVQYCSSATLEELLPEGGSDRPQAIMTEGREAMATNLRVRVQAAVDEAGLGIEIVNLAFTAVHPPHEAAEAYEEVLAARITQETARLRAEAYARGRYISVAGDARLARRLSLLLHQRDDLSSLVYIAQSGQDVRAAIEQVRRAVGEQLAAIDETIGREVLLDQHADDFQTDAQAMRGQWAAYGQTLDSWLADTLPDQAQLARELASVEAQLDTQFARVGGQSGVAIANAQAERWQVEMANRGRGDTFAAVLPAWRANRQLYELDRYLDVWDRVLPDMPKYVIGVDPTRLETWLDLARSSRAEDRLTFDDLRESD